MATAASHSAALMWILSALFILNILGSSDAAGDDETAFILNLQWGATYVIREEISAENLYHDVTSYGYRFTAHGLWELNGATYCGESHLRAKFDHSTLVSISEMHKYWPSFYVPEDNRYHKAKLLFWKHEWDKHGTCITQKQISGLAKPHEYFDFTLQLSKGIDRLLNSPWSVEERGPYEVFLDPQSDGQTIYSRYTGQVFSLLEFKTNLHMAVNALPTIKCYPYPPNAPSRSLIESIEFCFNRHLDLINCSDTPTSDNTCDSTVELPIFLSGNGFNIDKHFIPNFVARKPRMVPFDQNWCRSLNSRI